MGIGAALQQARAARGLTRERLMSLTRIPLRIIVAMEQDDWRNVPGGIFARGYLRAYAREVGLDGDALAAQYAAEQAPPPPAADVETPAGLARPVLRVRWPAIPEDARRWLAGPAFVALIFLVYVIGRASAPDTRPAADPLDLGAPTAVAATGANGEQPRAVGTASARRATRSSPASSVTAGSGSAPVGAPTGGREGSQPPDAAPRDTPLDVAAPLVLDVQVTRACWVTASADATRVVYRLLQPGERVQARGRVITLRVGDAGALKISLDGEPAKPLGASGQVLSVRITRDNYRSLLAPRAG